MEAVTTTSDDVPKSPLATRPSSAVPRATFADPAADLKDIGPPRSIAADSPHILGVPAGPMIQGVICSRSHFNDPGALFCCACGISMTQRTLELVEGQRPPLGVLVLDDGTMVTLDSNYVIGREPEKDPAVLSGEARPLALRDPARTVSRVHAGLVLDGWNVEIIDLGSGNGTFISSPVPHGWVALAAHRPTPIKPGTRIRLGQQVVRFDSARGIR